MKLSLAVPVVHSSQASVLVNRVALAVVLIIALSVRFNSIAVPVIWYDEAYSLLLARETPARIWALTALDVHPPLYYVLLHYWVMVWGESPFSARALSALADVGTLLLCIKLMSLVATRRATWIAALLLALLPISVRYSQEVRMYTLLGFWLMGATVALVCWAREPEKKRLAFIYVMLMVAAFYTHYCAGLCVFTHWLWWVFSIRRGNSIPARIWFLINGVIVLLFLPWVPSLLEQFAVNPSTNWMPALSWQSVLVLVWRMVVNHEAENYFLWWQVLPPFFLVVCAVVGHMKNQDSSGDGGLLAGYFFIPVVILIVVCIFKNMLHQRYLYFAVVGAPMIVAVFLDTIWRVRRGWAVCVLILLVVGEAQVILTAAKIREGFGPFALMTEQINLQYRIGDEILIDDLKFYLPFVIYNTTAIEPKIYVGKFSRIEGGYPDRFGWALLPDIGKKRVFDENSLPQFAKRVWLIGGTLVGESLFFNSLQWKKTAIIHGAEVDARLFVRK